MNTLDLEYISKDKKASVFYHNLFDYPLNEEELTKWRVGKIALPLFPKGIKINRGGGFYFINGREGVITLRRRRSVYSQRKIGLARRAVSFISFLPTVRMVALTGSLAMLNADSDADIDLMFVTKSGFLWTTRFLVYVFLLLFGIPFRRFGEGGVKDRLCLNIWLDESNLSWDKRNIFTAHEIAQVLPIVNKNGTYEKFLLSNLWAFDFWPNAIGRKVLGFRPVEDGKVNVITSYFWLPLELIFFFIQRIYALGKPNKGLVGLKKAIFHPVDFSSLVLSKIKTS